MHHALGGIGGVGAEGSGSVQREARSKWGGAKWPALRAVRGSARKPRRAIIGPSSVAGSRSVAAGSEKVAKASELIAVGCTSAGLKSGATRAVSRALKLAS